MNPNNSKLILIGTLFLLIIFLPIIVTDEPQNEEAPIIIIPSLTILFVLVNPIQDLIEVILWTFVIKEIYIVNNIRKGDI